MTIAFVLALSSSVVTPSGRRVSTTALVIYAYVDFFGVSMLGLEQIDRPATRCVTEVCQF